MAEEIKTNDVADFTPPTESGDELAYLFEESTDNYDEGLFGNSSEDNKPIQQSVEDLTNEEPTEQESNLIYQLLEAKGIKDALIKIEGEDGIITDIPFNELTSEEQFNILNTPQEDPYNFNEVELGTISWLRENNVTLEQTIDYFSKKAVEEALANNTATDNISEFTDEEIYVYDFVTKYKDLELTEEQIQIELDKQREHPDLFKQKTDILRAQYLKIEQDEISQKELEIAEQEQEKFNKITEDLVSVAKDVEDIGGIDLEIEDKKEVLQFILNKDVNGVSEFGKILDDPKALFEIAWYAKKGKEAFDVIHTYYKDEISKATKVAYDKGKAEATPKQPVETTSKLRNVVKGKQNNKPPGNQYPDADILYEGI